MEKELKKKIKKNTKKEEIQKDIDDIHTILIEISSKIKLRNQLKGEIIEKAFTTLKDIYDQISRTQLNDLTKLYRNYAASTAIIADLRHEFEDITMKMKYFIGYLDTRRSDESSIIKQHFMDSMQTHLNNGNKSMDAPSFDRINKEIESILSEEKQKPDKPKAVPMKPSVIKSTLVDLYDDMMKQKNV